MAVASRVSKNNETQLHVSFSQLYNLLAWPIYHLFVVTLTTLELYLPNVKWTDTSLVASNVILLWVEVCWLLLTQSTPLLRPG